MKTVVAFQAWWLTKLSEGGGKKAQKRLCLKVQLRPDEIVRAWGNAKVVGDVWCRKVVHFIVEKNSSPEQNLYPYTLIEKANQWSTFLKEEKSIKF